MRRKSSLFGGGCDGFDLDHKFRPYQAGRDDQRRRRRRPRKLAVARTPVTIHVLAGRHIDAQPDDVRHRHPIFGQDRRNVCEADIGLRFAGIGNPVIAIDAELPRNERHPAARGHGDAVAVARQGGRMDEGDSWRIAIILN